MKQSNMAIIGAVIIIAIIAIVALALSGQSSGNTNPAATAGTTGSGSAYNYTTAVTTAASNAINSTTSIANSTGNVTNSSVPKTKNSSTNSSTAKNGVMVGVSSKVGNYLESSDGFTLYLLNSDTPYKTSTCTGACTSKWPPFIFNGNLSSLNIGTGLNESAFGSVNRGNDTLQLTYYGWPVYFFFKDTAPGQVNGNGIYAFGGTWYAVTVPKPTTS